MDRWEYRVLASKDIPSSLFKQRTREAVEEYLNELGDDGWEVVNMDFVDWDGPGSFMGIAKRPKR